LSSNLSALLRLFNLTICIIVKQDGSGLIEHVMNLDSDS
jgi:hypothetical protein